MSGCHRKEEDSGKDRSTERHHEAERPVTAPTNSPAIAAPSLEPDAKLVHAVPVGMSPVRGKSDALVTLVEFSEFQCSFCRKAEATVSALRTQYGDDLRIVWKNDPMTNHPRAKPAADLALEARDEKGDATFWLVHDVLFEMGPDLLDDGTLLTNARNAGLSEPRVKSALAAMKHQAIIDDDVALAKKLGVSGTPTFFINGHVLVGAQSVDAFRALIDSELEKAKAHVASGTARAKVYDAVMAEALPGPITP
jgi:protein-disulfide isomerase